MKIRVIAIYLVLLLFSLNGYTGDSVAEKAQLNLSNILYEPLAEGVEARLSDSGLLQSEIEKIADDVADGYARCFVDFFEGRTEEEFREALQLMADGVDDSELRSSLDDGYHKIGVTLDVHESELDACTLTVQQNLGIPGESLLKTDY